MKESFCRAGVFVIEFEVGVDELHGGVTIPVDIAESGAHQASKPTTAPLPPQSPILALDSCQAERRSLRGGSGVK